MREEMVILVDTRDNERGLMEKQEAHVKGELHRAFSVMVFNTQGEMLLQQRAANKYHSAGLWTNTCCSHPRPGESTIDAAHRRLQEEMGFDCELELHQTFIYQTAFENGLSEHELDHVFIGRHNENPKFNELEVSNFRWISLNDLRKELARAPQLYTVWFKMIMDNYIRL